MQRAIENVYVSDSVGGDIVAPYRTRDSSSVQVGASPRGTLAVMKLSRVKAALDGRDLWSPTTQVRGGAGGGPPARARRPELWVRDGSMPSTSSETARSGAGPGDRPGAAVRVTPAAGR